LTPRVCFVRGWRHYYTLVVTKYPLRSLLPGSHGPFGRQRLRSIIWDGGAERGIDEGKKRGKRGTEDWPWI